MSGRCRSCDAIMSEAEMKRKHAETGEYFDLCTKCLREVDSIVSLPVSGAPLGSYVKEEKDE